MFVIKYDRARRFEMKHAFSFVKRIDFIDGNKNPRTSFVLLRDNRFYVMHN